MSATTSATILAACPAAAPSQVRPGALASAPSTALPMEPSSNRRRPAQSSPISEKAAPIVPIGDSLLGKTRTTRPRRLG